MNLSKLFENKSSLPVKNNGSGKKLLLKKKIFGLLYLEGPKTIADLCIPAGVSIPTMTRIMHELIREGWVAELGTGESRGGRRPVFFGLNPEARRIIGIDITRKYIRINIFDLRNRPAGKTVQKDIGLEDVTSLPKILKTLVNELIKKHNLEKSSILGAGISLPGLIDKKTNISYSYPGLGDKPLDEIFGELLGIPAYIEHDTKTMALGEAWFGLAKNKSNVLCLNIGAGVGLGMILKGELYQGHSGYSGEFGHIQMVPDGELCDCGKIGCLETIASGSSIVARAKQRISEGTNSIIKKMVEGRTENIRLPDVIFAARQGDQFAIELLEEAGGFLARGIAVLIHLLNPEMIIIGGDMAGAGNLLADPVQQKLNKYTINRIRQDTAIHISELGEQAMLLGTIPVVMTRIFSQEPNINNINNQ
ncbi:MAG: ROK family transcriptional regulator [Marinilabiliales bacterium]|nr:MAG: ROK family transcriptional regulator [Marinilabiliales bacterium]